MSSQGYQLQEKLDVCEMDNAAACFNVSLIYQKGDGVKQDHTKANGFHAKVCGMNIAAACHSLAISNKNGEGVRKDKKEQKNSLVNHVI